MNSRWFPRNASGILWASSAFLLGLPLTNSTGPIQSYDFHRLMQMTLLASCAVALVLNRSLRSAAWDLVDAMPAVARRSLAGFFLLGLVSATLSPLPRWSLLEWCLTAQLCALVLATAAAGKLGGRHGLQVLEAGVIWCVVGLCTLLCAGYAGSIASGLLDWTTLHPGFSNRRFLGHAMTMTVPLVIAAASRDGRYRGALWLLSATWWCWTIGNGSRGTLLGLSFGFICVGIVIGRRAARFWFTAMTSLLAGVAAFVMLAFLVPYWAGAEVQLEIGRFTSGTSLLHTMGRDLLWADALDMWAAHPWLGAGPMMFATLGTISSHPHGWVPQLLSEWGGPACLLAMLAATAAGRSLWRSRSVADGEPVSACRNAAVLCAAAGGLAQSMIDGVMVVPTSQVLLAIMFGWLWASSSSVDVSRGTGVGGATSVGDNRRGPVAAALAGAALVTAAGLLGLSSPEWRNPGQLVNSYESRYITMTYLDRLAPRFWLQGRLQPSPGQPYLPWN